MNVNDKLKELLTEDSRANALIASKLGMKGGQALDSRLRSTSTPKIDFVAALLDELGYELVAIPKTWFINGGQLPKGSFVIERDFEYKHMSNRAKGAAARVEKQRSAKNSEK